MSLAIIIKKDDVVYLGADSLVTTGSHTSTISSEGEQKIRKVGSCYVCVVGGTKLFNNLLQYHEFFELNGRPLTKKFVVNNIMNNLHVLLTDLGLMTYDKYDLPLITCSLLITDGKKIFVTGTRLQVYEINSVYAIGTGYSMALQILQNTEIENPEEEILKVLRLASKMNNGIGNPYLLVNTRDNEFKLVEE